MFTINFKFRIYVFFVLKISKKPKVRAIYYLTNKRTIVAALRLWVHPETQLLI